MNDLSGRTEGIAGPRGPADEDDPATERALPPRSAPSDGDGSPALDGLADAGRIAIITKTLDGTITGWNEGATSIYGYTKKEMIGRSISILVPPHLQDEELRLLDCRHGRPSGPIQTVRLRKGGEQIHVSLSATLVRNDDGVATGAVLISQDITRNFVLKERLRLQNKKIEDAAQTVAGFTHDVGNLLAIIMSCCDEILSRPQCPPQEADEIARRIRCTAEVAASLANRLVESKRVHADAIPVHDLNGVVDALRGPLKELLRPKIQLDVTLDPEACLVQAEPSHLEQLVVNLVLNAHDAMPTGGRLRIRTRNLNIDEAILREWSMAPSTACVRLSVSDTGGGMSADVLARVFEPGFSTKAADREPRGMGLKFVRDVVRECGGHIEVRSSLGRGTKFEIYFNRIGLLDERDPFADPHPLS